MIGLWQGLPAWAQDAGLLAALLAPSLAVGALLLRGFAPWPLIGGLLRRHAGVNAVFVALIATSVALGTAVLSQERALREGTARAAAPFPLIVAAPGSEVTAMLAAVYLQPADMALIDGPTYEAIASAEGVALAAPIAFGDSHAGAPVVGTTAAFVEHLGGIEEGRPFAARHEAVAGAGAPAGLGATFEPAHGQVEPEEGAHGGFAYEVVGVMPPTGSPWDRALLVPVESVWEIHGLSDGHGLPDGEPGAEPIGPPFDPAFFPGTPAALVVGDGARRHLPAARRVHHRADDGVLPRRGAVPALRHPRRREARDAGPGARHPGAGGGERAHGARAADAPDPAADRPAARARARPAASSWRCAGAMPER